MRLFLFLYLESEHLQAASHFLKEAVAAAAVYLPGDMPAPWQLVRTTRQMKTASTSRTLQANHEGQRHLLRSAACVHQTGNHVWVAGRSRSFMLHGCTAIHVAAFADGLNLLPHCLRCGMPQLI